MIERVLVTGADGFIGGHLVEDQLRRGRHVTAVDIHTDFLSQLSNPRLTVIPGSFADSAALDRHLAGHDVCFHLASAHLETGVSDQHYWQTNVEATREFAERCQSAGIGRFVHCSTVGIYGDIKQPPADEQSPTNPENIYEKTKLAGELAVREFADQSGYPVVVIRPAWVFGPRCPRTQKLFRAVQKGRFFYVGDGTSLRHPIYIDDMTAGFELAGTHPEAPGQAFIMGGPRAVQLRELMEEIAACLDLTAPGLHLPKWLVWPAVTGLEFGFRAIGRDAPYSRRSLKFFTGNTAFRTRLAADVLGFHPDTDLREGLEMTTRWLADQ